MTALALVLGTVLLVGCFGKLRDLTGFHLVVLRALPTFPVLANTLVVAVPSVELVVGASLVSGVRASTGAWLSVGLFGALAGWVVSRLLAGAGGEPCGCAMPVGPQTLSPALAVRNGFLTALALVAALVGPADLAVGGLAVARLLGGGLLALALTRVAADRSTDRPPAAQVKESHDDRR